MAVAETKRCTRCREYKPFTEFYRRTGKGDGFHTYCKKCEEPWTRQSASRYLKKKEALRATGDIVALDRIQQSRTLTTRTYKQNNRETYNAYQRRWNKQKKEEAHAAYGGVCSCCGETNPFFLTLDHLQNDGHKARVTDTYSVSIYAWAKKNNWPDTLALRCFNCNCARHRNLTMNNDDRCPHEIERLQFLDIAAFSALKAA